MSGLSMDSFFIISSDSPMGAEIDFAWIEDRPLHWRIKPGRPIKDWIWIRFEVCREAPGLVENRNAWLRVSKSPAAFKELAQSNWSCLEPDHPL